MYTIYKLSITSIKMFLRNRQALFFTLFMPLMIMLIFFAGIQLLTLGVIGEYLGRLFMGSNQTPQFVIREIHSQNPKDKFSDGKGRISDAVQL